MTDTSPLVEAQERFTQALPLRATGSETCPLPQALGRTLYSEVTATTDLPPYHRAIVEGFLVNAADTDGASSEDQPVTFNIVAEVAPGDAHCPAPRPGEAVQVYTGSVVPEGPYAVVRQWEAQRSGDAIQVSRPFPPRFFIEEQGSELTQGVTVLPAGSTITPGDLGTIASLGVAEVQVARPPKVAVFACGDEVVPYTAPIQVGQIRDCDSVMLAAAAMEAGAVAEQRGIMPDDMAAFESVARQALAEADMLTLAGGTAAGGRDFISELVARLGEVLVDGVPMRSGRPLIMGVAEGKPICCVAGHPPEALRGFQLFGVTAINRLLGRNAALPVDR